MSDTSQQLPVAEGDPGYTFGAGKRHLGGTLKDVSEAVRRAVKNRKCQLRRWNQRLWPKAATPQPVAP